MAPTEAFKAGHDFSNPLHGLSHVTEPDDDAIRASMTADSSNDQIPGAGQTPAIGVGVVGACRNSASGGASWAASRNRSATQLEA